MTAAEFWWVNTVTVTPYLGGGASGPVYGPTQTVACWIEDETKLVRDNEGSEVVSSATIYAPLEAAASFPAKSKVTTPTRTGYVIGVNAFDSGSLDLGLDHIQVTLT